MLKFMNLSYSDWNVTSFWSKLVRPNLCDTDHVVPERVPMLSLTDCYLLYMNIQCKNASYIWISFFFLNKVLPETKFRGCSFNVWQSLILLSPAQTPVERKDTIHHVRWSLMRQLIRRYIRYIYKACSPLKKTKPLAEWMHHTSSEPLLNHNRTV